MAHKHTITTEKTRAWTGCVTPEACAVKPERQRAHGAVIHIQECKCGATRYVETNQQWSNKTMWEKGQK